MSFLIDPQELKKGLIIFKRADVKHQNWYCRIKVPKTDKYKVIALKTPDVHEAKERAFDVDADIRFRVKHDVPVFEKSFADVAQEYSDLQKAASAAGQITKLRWQVIDGHIRCSLIPYIGNQQITLINQEKWQNYPLWRKQNGKSIGGSAKDGTIRQEMMTFRAIMNYAADKHYIRERQIPRGKVITDKARREEFTPSEYRQLHTYARKWIKEGLRDNHIQAETFSFPPLKHTHIRLDIVHAHVHKTIWIESAVRWRRGSIGDERSLQCVCERDEWRRNLHHSLCSGYSHTCTSQTPTFVRETLEH